MLSINAIPQTVIKAVFTDLDGTLTDAGGISSTTFTALHDLKKHGIKLVVVSGRPAGWADALMRLWPLDAMIFENGAGIILRDKDRLRTIALASDKPINEQRGILESAYRKLHLIVPSIKLASDQPYRLYDYAIDYAEESPYLSKEEVERLMTELSNESHLTVKLSSIHINFWYGTHTKVTACRHLLANEPQFAHLKAENVAFCGDSPNDEPLFEFFPHSIGVANVRPFLSRMKFHPRYVANAPGGAGFVEVTQHLLIQARQGSPAIP